MKQSTFQILTEDQLDMVVGAAGCNGNDSVDAKAGFVNTWHGLGCCHQEDETGTAVDRHNFLTIDGGSPAGSSGVNPTSKSSLA